MGLAGPGGVGGQRGGGGLAQKGRVSDDGKFGSLFWAGFFIFFFFRFIRAFLSQWWWPCWWWSRRPRESVARGDDGCGLVSDELQHNLDPFGGGRPGV